MKSYSLRLRILSFVLSCCVSVGLQAQHHERELLPCGVTDEPATECCPTGRLQSGWLRNADLAVADAPFIAADSVFRTYRLALAVDYKPFVNLFENSKDSVYRYWNEAEKYLNTLYQRDLGIQFKVIRHDSLIRTTEEQALFNNFTMRAVINFSTYELNRLITKEAYDLGVFLVDGDKVAHMGIADILGAYRQATKGAACVSTTRLSTLAHEIGHLFGSYHTFSRGGVASYATEIDFGQSTMSYGHPRHFFSLVSISKIKEELSALPYYTDETRTKVVGTHKMYDNFVPGVVTRRFQPRIVRGRLQPHYRLPKSTFFQFKIPVDANKSDSLLFAAQQADIRTIKTSNAKFMTFAASADSLISFQTLYSEAGTESYTFPSNTGSYRFCLSVSDGGKSQGAPIYDSYLTQVEVVEGKPFVQTAYINPLCKMGDHILLKWQVDSTIFSPASRVRILLSDDFGKTFRHVLHPSTPNDGSCEVILPFIPVGEMPYGALLQPIRAGVIKIEVIDHIAFALTESRPMRWGANNYPIPSGGFVVEPSQFTFTNAPEQTDVVIYDDEPMPELPDVSVVSRCRRGVPTLRHSLTEETVSDSLRLVTNLWTATDVCDNRSSVYQRVWIKKRPATTRISTQEDVRSRFVLQQHKGYFTLLNNGEVNQVEVFDTKGTLLRRYPAVQQYPTYGFQPGIYLVKIYAKDGSATGITMVIKP